MTRILTITLEVTDEETSALLARIAERGAFVSADAGNGEDDGDQGGTTPADPGTLDKNGVPWIETVHASTKGLTKDGLWRGKKGVSPEQRKATEDAWKTAHPNPTFPVPASISGVPGGINLPMPGPAPTMPPVGAPVGGMPSMPSAAAPSVPAMPAMPGPAPTPPPVTVPAARPVITFDQVSKRAQELIANGKVTAEWFTQCYQSPDLGINGDPSQLIHNETARAIMWNWMDQIAAT